MIIQEILKDIRSLKRDEKSLKKFGITLAVALGLLAGYQAWRHHNGWVWMAALSVLLLLLARLCPKILSPVQTVWMTLAFVMGFVMTRVILFVLFFFVVTPIGVLGRLFGNQFLDRGWKENKECYWILREKGKIEKSQYENQF